MFKSQLKASNAIFLEEQNTEQGRPFKARFLEAGFVKYDFGLCLLKKTTIDKFLNTFIGKPVIIDHKDDIEPEDVVGIIDKVWFNTDDGWFWCSGFITDGEAIKLIQDGYSVSCQYDITDYEVNEAHQKHNQVLYDKEITNGLFEHLAIVKNPRYEEALIAVNKIQCKRDVHMFKTKKGVDSMQNENNKLLMQIVELLKARNEADEDKKKACNEDVDKRKLIDEVAGIMKDAGADDELIRTAIEKMEMLAYDDSEAGTVDNEDDDVVDKRDIIRKIMAIAGKYEDNEDVRTIAKLAEKLAYDESEADNKGKNKDEQKEEAYEEFKKDVEEEAKNKAKNSIKSAKKSFYGSVPSRKRNFMTLQEGIAAGDKLYS